MSEIIVTKQADCKDCYRCLRTCPVKAIGFTSVQARINEEKCILCGKCVVECPQQAKIVRNHGFKVSDLFAQKERVILSLAPSFPASYKADALKVREALLELGFSAVEETAVGAVLTSEAYKEVLAANPSRTWLTSCCPVIVNLVEKYYPTLKANLLPVISPMIAHARYLQAQYGEDVKVVFAGPCIAKLKEAEDYKLAAALTFSQLKSFWTDNRTKTVSISQDKAGLIPARLFPLHNGVLHTLKGKWDIGEEYWSVDGLEQCREILESLAAKAINPQFIEMMACAGGCMGGPGIDSPYPLFKRRQKITDYYRQRDTNEQKPKPECLNFNFSMDKEFFGHDVLSPTFSEEEIRAVLTKMGKNSVEDERNCEGCGYNSCREKAIAVLEGMAVPEMCVPYMRTKAESFANVVVQNSPNAIIVLNETCEVLDFNPAAQKLFPEIPFRRGLKLENYLDTKNIQFALQRNTPITDLKIAYPEWGLLTRQNIRPLPEDRLAIALITNITEAEGNYAQMQQMRSDVMEKAKDVINKQMRVAQTIAGLLGETTADTKVTLAELLKHMEMK